MRSRTILTAVIGSAILAGAWFALAPPALGGSTAYVIVARGISMEPRYHQGDLVLVRKGDYAQGDAIAYRDAQTGRVVLHRVLERESDRLVTKGDNNSFVDPFRPEIADVLGKAWVRVPGGGRFLGWLRTPRVAGALGGAAAFVALAGNRVRARRRRRRATDARAADLVRAPGAHGVARGSLARAQSVLAGLAALSVAAAALSVFLGTKPLRMASRAAYAHSGSFGYSAASRMAGLYDGGRARTGDPVFVRTSDAMLVRFAYRFASEHPHQLSGSWASLAELRGPNGWRRRVVSTPRAPFTGDAVDTALSVDLRKTIATIARAETGSGVRHPFYDLSVIVRVSVDGVVATRPVTDSFEARLAFRIDRDQIQLAAGPDGSTPALEVEREGSVLVPDGREATVSAYGISLPIARARTLATTVAVAAAVLMVLIALGSRYGRSNELNRILRVHRPRIIQVERLGLDGARIVELSNFDSLLRVAERYERVIMHSRADGIDRFVVDDDSTIYRFTPGGEPTTEEDDAAILPIYVPVSAGVESASL